MLSARRIVEVFRWRGGGEFANLTETLTANQIAYLAEMAGDDPIIAMIPSRDEWLALTKSHFVVSRGQEQRRVSFDEICSVAMSEWGRKDLRKFEHIKVTGGDLDVDLLDGTTLQVTVKPGGPYFGLMNVLMRIATINRRRRMPGTSGSGALPTTDDQQPTTPL